MRLSVRFDDLDNLIDTYDPVAVQKAAHATIKQLQGKAATEVSRSVRKTWAVSAGAIKSALQLRTVNSGNYPAGVLIYTGNRFSLRHFATRTVPKVRTTRGVRYGARVKDRKDRRAYLVPGGFFGKGKNTTEKQIFQRVGQGRLPIRKLTAPAIAQMVGGKAPLQAINDLMQREADEKFANNLDHFLLKKTGLR